LFDGPDEVHMRTIARAELGREKSPLAAAATSKGITTTMPAGDRSDLQLGTTTEGRCGVIDNHT
ncbi:hypothetical protein P3H80_08715, partial [Mycolicibacterium septicum]|uniref:hypothetical protein n=1 Tax=Mycolicibacterium septicum TaxID=98668 RepID=UPI0023E0BDAD